MEILVSVSPKSDSSRFNRLMAVTVIPLLVVDIVLERLVHLDALEELRVLAHLSVGSPGLWVLAAAYCYCRWRGMTKLEDISQLFAWSLLVIPAISFLIPVAGRSPYPLVDTALARIDADIHFQTVAVVHWVSHHPVLRRTLAIAYLTLPPLILASLLVPPLCGRAVDSRRYVLAVLIAAVMTAALFAFWPAAGPWTMEGFAPTKSQAAIVDSLALLKSGQPLPEGAKSAVVAFPSFHIILAVLSLIALWNVRWARWFVFSLCILICVSTISTGWHYLIDVIGGLAVTYLAQTIANAALEARPSPVGPELTREQAEIIPV
jgi:membrane-associated phospholipid phosphatase